MADPLETNLDIVKDALNVQKEITQEVEARRRILEQIDQLDTSIAKTAYRQMALSSSQGEKLKKSYDFLINARRNLAGMEEGFEKKSLKKRIESREEEIRFITSQMQLAKMRWEVELKKLQDIKKQHDFVRESIKQTVGIQFKELQQVSKFKEDIATIFPKMRMSNVMLGASFLMLASFARNMYETFEKAAWQFRKTTGMTRDSGRELRKIAENTAIEMAHLNVQIGDTYKAILALGPAMGSYHNVSKEAVKTVSLFAAQLGVAEDNIVGVMRMMALTSRTTMQAQKHSAYFSANLAAAAGVPLNDVMADVAHMSGLAYSMISKTPLAIMKAAVEARRLNTTINDMARANASILDFQNSVNAEMEASVLLGESVNLQQARYLAYNGKIVESTNEMLRLAKQHGFQTKMDYFQREAFAKATGRSVEELLKMLQAEEEMAAARRSTDAGVQSQLKAYEQLKAANEATTKQNGKNYEMMLMQRANQERMTSIQNQWNQLLMQASQIFLPIIDASLKFIGVLMQGVKGLFALAMPAKMLEQMLITVVKIGKAFGVIKEFTRPIGYVAHILGTIANKIVMVGGLFGKIGAMIGTWAGPLMKFVSPFLKFLGPIGWVITAFQLISSIWKNFDLKAPFFGLDKVIKEVLFAPFIKAWEWIKSIFVGRSPSFLAMGIVKGLASAAGMIMDVLTYPWRTFLAWVIDKVPFMGDVAKKLRGGFTGAMAGGVEKEAIAAYVPVMEVKAKPQETEIPTKKKIVKDIVTQTVNDKTSEKLGDILEAIQALNKNLQEGKIGVYIDGQLMSATLARQTAFKGGYGMNVV